MPACVRVLAARFRPSCSNSLAPLGIEGAGNAGCALHPRSRVPKLCIWAHTSIQGSGNTPTSPAQWHYGLLRALPGERAFLPPSPLRSLLLKSLTPASRRQDHTTSPYALAHSSALARLNKSVHRIPHPTCRDDHDTPLLWARDERGYNSDFQNCEAKYFCLRGLDMSSDNQK